MNLETRASISTVAIKLAAIDAVGYTVAKLNDQLDDHLTAEGLREIGPRMVEIRMHTVAEEL